MLISPLVTDIPRPRSTSRDSPFSKEPHRLRAGLPPGFHFKIPQPFRICWRVGSGIDRENSRRTPTGASTAEIVPLWIPLCDVTSRTRARTGAVALPWTTLGSPLMSLIVKYLRERMVRWVAQKTRPMTMTATPTLSRISIAGLASSRQESFQFLCFGDHGDSAFGDRHSSGEVSFSVVADLEVGRNFHIFIDDRLADLGVAADLDAIEED